MDLFLAFLKFIFNRKKTKTIFSTRKPIFLTSNLKRAKQIMNNGLGFFQFRVYSVKNKLKT